MSKTEEKNGYTCKECSKYYKTKGNATKHAKETGHLDFHRGFVDKEKSND